MILNTCLHIIQFNVIAIQRYDAHCTVVYFKEFHVKKCELDFKLGHPKSVRSSHEKWPTHSPSKAEQLPPKFHGLVLGLVRLIEAKGIGVAQPIWLRDCAFFCF